MSKPDLCAICLAAIAANPFGTHGCILHARWLPMLLPLEHAIWHLLHKLPLILFNWVLCAGIFSCADSGAGTLAVKWGGPGMLVSTPHRSHPVAYSCINYYIRWKAHKPWLYVIFSENGPSVVAYCFTWIGPGAVQRPCKYKIIETKRKKMNNHASKTPVMKTTSSQYDPAG